MAGKHDTIFTRLIRYLMLAVFLWAIWIAFGWGVSIATFLVLIATGIPGVHRFVFVPVSGLTRLVLEFIVTVLGVWALYAWLGSGWGIVLLVVFLLAWFAGSKRIRYLLQQRN